MPTEIKIALISLLGILITGAASIVAQVIQARKTQSEIIGKLEHQSEVQDIKLDSKLEKYAAVTDTKIQELTREVREHNNFARRVPVLEEKVSALEKNNKQ